MGRIRRGRSQRREVKRITDDYLDSIQHKLTPRDMKILECLDRFGVMNSWHLQVLCEGTETLPPFWTLAKGQQRLNDRLRTLFDLNLIHKASPLLAVGMGTSKQYVWLDRGGIKLVASGRESRGSLPANYLHSSQILDVYCQLTQWERQGRIKLFYLKREDVQASWPVIPDLIVLFRYQGRGYLYAIEVDRSEKKEKDEIQKIESYRNWQLSAAWLQEPWARILPKPRFPYVMYLFDAERRQYKKRQTMFQRAAAECRLPFRSATLPEFSGFLDSIQ